MLGLCGLVVASISVGVDVAVHVEHLGREPLLHPADRRDRLRLRLREVVAVEVEPVAVGARAGDPAVGVLDRVEDEDRVAEDRVDLRVGAVRGRGELLDRVHRGVDALVLVAVDAALDEDRHLHVVAEVAEQLLRGLRALEHQRAHAEPAEVVALLLARAQAVDDDAVHVAAGRRLADHLQAHPAAAARLDVLRACSRSRSTGCAGSCRRDASAGCRRAGSRRRQARACRTTAARRPRRSQQARTASTSRRSRKDLPNRRVMEQSPHPLWRGSSAQTLRPSFHS